jgi:hypothetical protein
MGVRLTAFVSGAGLQLVLFSNSHSRSGIFAPDYDLLRPQWQDDIENSQSLELLCPITAVVCLSIPSEFVPRIAPSLQYIVRREEDFLSHLNLASTYQPQFFLTLILGSCRSNLMITKLIYMTMILLWDQ